MADVLSQVTLQFISEFFGDLFYQDWPALLINTLFCFISRLDGPNTTYSFGLQYSLRNVSLVGFSRVRLGSVELLCSKRINIKLGA